MTEYSTVPASSVCPIKDSINKELFLSSLYVCFVFLSILSKMQGQMCVNCST